MWKRVASGPASLPDVVVARDYKFMCSSLGQELIEKDIKELGLTRVVVAACSPHLHEKTFRNACKRAGLNPYLCEMVSIREQVSWVHTDKAAATGKGQSRHLGRGGARDPSTSRSNRCIVPISTRNAGRGRRHRRASRPRWRSPMRAITSTWSSASRPSAGTWPSSTRPSPPSTARPASSRPRWSRWAPIRNITLLTWSEVEKVDGYVGNFTVTIRKKARYVKTELCTGCGICQEKCPKKVIDDVYEAGLGYRKAVYTPFPQAVPKYPVIDGENCTYFQKGTCKACEKFCPTDAIDFNQEDEYDHRPGRQHHPGDRLRPVRSAAHPAVRLWAAGECVHQPGVRATVQCRRADRTARSCCAMA